LSVKDKSKIIPTYTIYIPSASTIKLIINYKMPENIDVIKTIFEPVTAVSLFCFFLSSKRILEHMRYPTKLRIVKAISAIMIDISAYVP
jgi:hypothetical protein